MTYRAIASPRRSLLKWVRRTVAAASVWARMGHPDEAVQSLREAAETGFPCYPLFARDPNLDRIREDPRFKAFLAEMEKQSASLRKALFEGR